MQTRFGRVATKKMTSPRSSACSMRARSSALTGTGRWSRIGVATSPGQMTDERMPLSNSSMLIVWLIATTACFAAV